MRAPFKPEPDTVERVQYFGNALSERASALTSTAQRCKQKLCDAANIDWSDCDDDEGLMDEWLEERVAAFEALHPQSLSTAKHLGHIVATASETILDANAVLFPVPEPMMRPMWQQARPTDLDGARAEAQARPHKEAEVAMWGQFNEQVFVLPGSDAYIMDGGGADIGLIVVDEPYDRHLPVRFLTHPLERNYTDLHRPWGHSVADETSTGPMLEPRPQACHDSRREREAGLARSPEELRPWLYGEAALAPLDMSFPDGQGAAWSRWGASGGTGRLAHRKFGHQSFYGECTDVIARDLCTEEQIRIIDSRQAANFWQPERVRARALKRKVLPGFLRAVPELLERDAAYSQLAHSREVDRAWEIADYEKRAEEGACETHWPTDRCWPKFSWAPLWQTLGRRSDERVAAAKACPPRPDRKPHLLCYLSNAVGRGDVAKVQRILKQGCRPSLKFDMWLRACSLKKQGVFRFPVLDADLEGEGKELLLFQMNGDQCSLKVDPQATLQDVLDRISSACASSAAAERSQLVCQELARHYVRFLTPSGEVVQDNSVPLSALFADGQWALTTIVQNRGSIVAAEILLSLLEARDPNFNCVGNGQAYTVVYQIGPALVQAACEVGNDAVVEILSRLHGFDSDLVLKKLCRKMEEFEGGASEQWEARFMKGLECVLKAWFIKTQANLLGGRAGAYRFQGVQAVLLPFLKHRNRSRLLSTEPHLWAGLLHRFDFGKIMDMLPEGLLASRSFILECLTHDSGWMVLARASADLKRDREILLLAVSMTPKAIDLVPREAWSNNLVLAAMQHEETNCDQFLFLLPPVEWTEELAWKACQRKRRPVNIVNFARWLPEALWTEGLALAIFERGGYQIFDLMPKFLLASRSFMWQVLKSGQGYRALSLMPDEFRSDQGLLLHAIQSNPKAAELVPATSWNTELALAAVENGAFDFMTSLPVSDWTQELAIKALASGASRVTLLEVLPSSAWSEELALNLVRKSERIAAVVPARLFSTSFTLRLAEQSWHSLIYLPPELLEDDRVRQALTSVLQNSSKTLSTELTDDSMDLMSVREHLELAEALATKPLFKKELLATAWTSQKAAFTLQLQFSMLATIKASARDSLDVTMGKLKSNIRTDFTQFRARTLAQVKDMPRPCVALLQAVQCILLAAIVPKGEYEGTLQDGSFHKKLTSMDQKDVEAIPMPVAIYIAEMRFLPSEGSGQSLCLWALDNIMAAKGISALAAWVLGVLQLKFRNSSPCADVKDMIKATHGYGYIAASEEITRSFGKDPLVGDKQMRTVNVGEDNVEVLKMRLEWLSQEWLTTAEQALGAESSSFGNPCDSKAQLKTDVFGLQSQLKEKGAIVEALELLERRLPAMIRHIKSGGSSDAWAAALTTGFEKVLEKAKALKEDTAAAARDLTSQVSSLDMERRDAAATRSHHATSCKDFQNTASLRRSHSLGFSASKPRAILSEAREFVESSSWPNSKLTRPFHLHQKHMARKAATKPSLPVKLPPLNTTTRSTTQADAARKRSHSLGGERRHTWSNHGNAMVDCLFNSTF